ncbi:hypothetical protein [Motiliproteus sp. SC1-56]|uniref:hypothetical protein n=1 Tax=Motiliproteus sp. SC1-56 TaxID=2799565 RepID=UPI001A902BD1|nr:hypothetical protein [Motiliproteus sp. SC1-56]
MSIDEAQLDRLARAIARIGLSETAMVELRRQFSGLRLTFCLEDELGAVVPYREYADFNLYLVMAGGNHCLTLTHTLDDVGGVLVAEL